MPSFEKLPSMKYQYTPGLASSGGVAKLSASSLMEGSGPDSLVQERQIIAAANDSVSSHFGSKVPIMQMFKYVNSNLKCNTLKS